MALRKAAGLNQLDVVAATDLSQAQLSRIEGARSLPTEEEAATLGRLYGATAEQSAELVGWTRDARAGIRDQRLVVQRGSTLAMQQRWRRIEGDATEVRAYQPAMVLGALQTAAYAGVVFGKPPDSAEVVERQRRVRRLIEEANRRHVLVQTEGSLLVQVGSKAVMAEQVEAVVAASRRPNVDLGILPAERAVQTITPSGFHLYDSGVVVVGLEVAAATLTDSADVSHFRSLFDRLAAAAVFGDEARDVLARIGARYR